MPRTFSRGIWKSVSLSTGLAVLHVVPEILYTGEYKLENILVGLRFDGDGAVLQGSIRSRG